MKKAKIYFKGSLICQVDFKSIMYIDGRELRGENNELVAVVTNSNMIVIEDKIYFEVNGVDLSNSLNQKVNHDYLANVK